jgi:flavin-dependent dehydrogenase
VGYVFDTDMPDGAYGAVADLLAPKGYAYVLVHGGRGTVASTIFDDFHNEKKHLAHTVEFFQRKVGLTMRNARRFGGTAHFTVPRSARRGQVLFTGEAAGFQDALWGFGMRYAIVSGHLAAVAMLNGRLEDYDFYWKARLGGLLRTGLTNRYLYEKLGDSGYVAFTNQIDRAADARAWLRRHYAPSLFKRALLPIARRTTRGRTESLCVQEGCDCTWCRCQHGSDAEGLDQHVRAA